MISWIGQLSKIVLMASPTAAMTFPANSGMVMMIVCKVVTMPPAAVPAPAVRLATPCMVALMVLASAEANVEIPVPT